MKRSAIFILLIVISCNGLKTTKMSKAETNQRPAHSTDMQGLYGAFEVISQKYSYKKEEGRNNSTNSKTLWIFCEGYYSISTQSEDQKKAKNCEEREAGFAFRSGTWHIQSGKMYLNQEFSSSPFYIGKTLLLKYKLNGDLLSLTETLNPTVELPQEGEIETILRRIRV